MSFDLEKSMNDNFDIYQKELKENPASEHARIRAVYDHFLKSYALIIKEMGNSASNQKLKTEPHTFKLEDIKLK